MLPDFAASEMRILRSSKASGYSSYDEVWMGSGLTGEPLVDSGRLEHDNVLSVMVMMAEDAKASRKKRNLAVLDFQL